jgi:predicted XRE-type DNA-binding protein
MKVLTSYASTYSLRPMTPQEAIQTLLGLQMNETQIAAAVGATQPTINRIRNGSDCLFRTGAALIKLAEAKKATSTALVAVGRGA